MMELFSQTDYSQSPFEKFIANEETRDSLYAEFTEIDEAHEIGARWIEFSKECLENLDLLSDLSHLLFIRFRDEFEKERTQIEQDPERKALITARMMSLLLLEIDASYLMQIYNDIRVNGIFGTKPEEQISEHFIHSIRHIYEVKSLFFEDIPKETLSPVSGVLKMHMKIEDLERLIPRMERYLSESHKYMIQQEKGREAMLKGEFYGSILGPMLVRLGDTWWWRDSISQHFVFDKSVSFLLKAIDEWSEVMTSDLKKEAEEIQKYNVAKASAEKNFSLALHYRRLAREAAFKGDFEAAGSYFADSLSLLEDARRSLEHVKDREDISPIYKLVDYRVKHTMLLKGISGLSHFFSRLLASLEGENKEEVEKLAQILKQEAVSLSDIIEEDYISAMPMIFESIGEIAELIIKTDGISFEEAKKRLFRSFVQFRKRIDGKANQIVQQWEDMISTNPLETRVRFTSLEEQLLYMFEAASLMPVEIEGRDLLLKRLKVMRDLAIAMISEIDSIGVTRENKVLELLLKAKAHHHSSRAKKIAEEIGNEKMVPIDRINAHYAGSFVSGINTQMSVYILAIQYLTLNVVLRALYDSMVVVEIASKENLEQILGQVERDFESLDGFKQMLSRIAQDCENLLSKKDEMEALVRGIQWQGLEIRRLMVDATLLLLDALKNNLLGRAYANVKEYSEAKGYYEEAKDASYKASDILAKVAEPFGPNSAEAQLAQGVYAFWQLCFDNESRTSSNREPQPVPPQDFLQLFRGVVFRL